MPYTCPECHKTVKHLKDHMKRMHPEKSGVKKQQADEVPSAEDRKQKVDKPGPQRSSATTFKIKKPAGSSKTYYCQGCGETITRGQAKCLGCGEELVWSGIDEN